MTKRALRRQRRVDAILESAIRAFRRHGYHGTSMDQIADQLLMTKGSLYYYFRDKEEILFAAHDKALGRILAEAARVRRGGGCPCEQLEEILSSHIRIMVDGFQGTALALEFGALSPRRLGEIVAKRDRYERGLRSLIAAGARDGCFRDVDPKLAGMALLGAINWIARWCRPDGPATSEQIARSFLDLFLRGLGSAARVPAVSRPRGHASLPRRSRGGRRAPSAAGAPQSSRQRGKTPAGGRPIRTRPGGRTP
jgi:AcrR family transcriptional regulator